MYTDTMRLLLIIVQAFLERTMVRDIKQIRNFSSQVYYTCHHYLQLHLVAKNEIIETFKNLCDTPYYFIDNEHTLKPLINYFHDTSIGCIKYCINICSFLMILNTKPFTVQLVDDVKDILELYLVYGFKLYSHIHIFIF